MIEDRRSPVALVTGASRGVGAAVARILAERGIDVLINYRSKGARAEAVAAQVQAAGQRATLVQADLTNPADRDRMTSIVAETHGYLSLLILNASGGLEKDKPASYAMEINYTAQLATVDTLAPVLTAPSTIVFVTSHWAHFYGQQPVLPAYEPVARSKKAGEEALRERIGELGQRGIRLLVVSGDVIEGTITPKLLDRVQPGVIEQRRAQVGALPTVEQFAAAIVDATLDPTLESGTVVYVGATE